ncbi:hypothetical protein EX30DRAFT_166653 [Ascodesmis nigricans]|uniref:Uncharacterized protein n=1 Tax=Ascodesmis nigricans TaxID=341454 RepID=A0A4S2MM18_9PEZI|nr:hypothetical protein EX30DRAFT_166653 [Ascodesmis nigricans]
MRSVSFNEICFRRYFAIPFARSVRIKALVTHRGVSMAKQPPPHTKLRLKDASYARYCYSTGICLHVYVLIFDVFQG